MHFYTCRCKIKIKALSICFLKKITLQNQFIAISTKFDLQMFNQEFSWKNNEAIPNIFKIETYICNYLQREQSDNGLYCFSFFLNLYYIENPTLFQFYCANYSSSCPLEICEFHKTHILKQNKLIIRIELYIIKLVENKR